MQCSVLRGSCHLGRIRSLFSSADWGGGSLRCEFTCSADVMPVHDAIISEGGLCSSVIQSAGEGRLCLSEARICKLSYVGRSYVLTYLNPC